MGTDDMIHASTDVSTQVTLTIQDVPSLTWCMARGRRPASEDDADARRPPSTAAPYRTVALFLVFG